MAKGSPGISRHYLTTDTGCKYHPECLKCPERPDCLEAMGKTPLKMAHIERNRNIVSDKANGMKVKVIAEKYGLKPSSIRKMLTAEKKRKVRDGNSGYSANSEERVNGQTK